MKIAFIGQKGIPAKFGGVEKHVEELATELARKGHKVFVYVRNNYTDKNLKEYKGVKLIHLPSISSKNLDAISHTFLATLHSLFRGYDIVHYQAIGPSSLSWIVKWLKWRTKVVVTFHCQDYLHEKWGFLARSYLRFGEYIACKISDKTIVISKILQNYARKKFGTDCVVIPNGSKVEIDTGRETLNHWELKPQRYIISVSRLVKHKGIHYLIEAFKNLEDTAKIPGGFKLVIVGDGFHTDDYVNYLKTISRGKNSIVFTGNQTGKDLSQLFGNAYLFVQPSKSEGLSIALLESMGYGVAALVSDIKENLEAIGKDGFSFQSGSIDDLQKKLAYLISRENEVFEMGQKARKRAQEEFGWNSIAEKTLKVYENLIVKKIN